MTTQDRLTAIAENQQKVYDAGKTARTSEFWDVYQDYGNRTNYAFAFGGYGWQQDLLTPKYAFPDSGIRGYMMFSRNNGTQDIRHLSRMRLSDAQYAFYLSHIQHIGEVEIAGGFYGTFQECTKLKSIDCLTLVSGAGNYSYAFDGATSLQNVTFDGVIERSLDMHWSPLTPASMKSAILHLTNYAGTDKEGTYKLTFSENCWTQLEADSTAPNGGTWRAYVASLGWNT